MNNKLKIFVFHKPSVQGHVINFSDLATHGLTDPNELSSWGVCDLINHPAVREEIIISFGRNNCLLTAYNEENFEVTYYNEL